MDKRLEAELDAMGLVVDIVAQLLSEEAEAGRAGIGSSGELWASLQAALGALSDLHQGVEGIENGRSAARVALRECADHVRARCSEREAREAENAASGGLLDLLELLGAARHMLRSVDVDNDPAARAAAARARDMIERADMERQLVAVKSNLRRVRLEGRVSTSL